MRIKIDIRNKNKFMIEDEIEKNNNFFQKDQEKKIEIKTMRTVFENIMPSIWIEWWN